jgi:hypothetical protein
MTDFDEARVRRLEDRMEINELMTTYALAVDADDWDKVADLWLDDGTYELDAIGTFVGPAGVKEMLTRPAHTFARENHGAHILSHPVILLEGDRAVATTYGQILTRENERHAVFRLIITRWELRRTSKGWRVARRVNKLVDNDGAARALAGAAGRWEWEDSDSAALA